MTDSNNNTFLQSLQLPLIFIGVLWFIHLLQFVLGLDLGWLGIYPRQSFGLRGILAAPLIHADFGHLISNSIPLLVLSTMIYYFYPRVAIRSFIMIYLLTGLAVWILARSVFHIGASGLVYGLVAFVAWNGIFRRNLKSIVLALVVLFFYGGMFGGLSPNQEGISWESHLYGALVGVFTSFFYKEEIEEDELEKPDPFANEPSPQSLPYFLPRDIFEKTRTQREEDRKRPPDDFGGSWISTHT